MATTDQENALGGSRETSTGLEIRRFLSNPDIASFDEVEWEVRDASIPDNRTGENAFEQKGVEFPKSWSQNATNIVAQKYFRGHLGSPERENSVRQMIGRVVDTITEWGKKDGYFQDGPAEVFREELTYILVNQMATFNSPVWFNVGTESDPQASACFILSVEDDMESILNWYVEEGMIFKWGSGTGINLSSLRSTREQVRGGGTASGPVSFMRGADASAGTIRSGGKTRRAAKMVILNVDHPDIRDFIWCKAVEEKKARVLRDAGFDMDIAGKDAYSVQYQNANNSVRVTDEFMKAVEDDRDWKLRAVTTGEVIETVRARDLLRELAQAAWDCADPGVQYDTTINDWHTCPASGRINSSNPCSEYMHLDNSACNLASLNLMKFLSKEGIFDVAKYKHVVEIMFIAQEILAGNASYPTQKIAENARAFRQIGLGYANLGALLMAQGLPYDSDGGRAWAASLTSIMTGHAYTVSAKIAKVMGPFEGYTPNAEAMTRVIKKHQRESHLIDAGLIPEQLERAAIQVWDDALTVGQMWGFRNAQATVLAPTGTISFMLDCDTTGIEPDLSLVKNKKLVGGGNLVMVNQIVGRALNRLGYRDPEATEILEYIHRKNTVEGAPHLNPSHYSVFDCAIGDRSISYMGHVKMMAAVQPFISGAISKTCNLPAEATVEDVERLFIEAWNLGLKAVAIYRDGCKVSAPMSASKSEPDVETPGHPVRRRLPTSRPGKTISFGVGDVEGYIIAGEYPGDGLGEIFLKVAKQGSTLSGIMDAFAIAVSIGLQYGVPLEVFASKFVNMKFEPAGLTKDDPNIRASSSLVDYVFRRLAFEYLPKERREALGVFTREERSEQAQGLNMAMIDLPPASGSWIENTPSGVRKESDAPFCFSCGSAMQTAGSCYVCSVCGSTSGCS